MCDKKIEACPFCGREGLEVRKVPVLYAVNCPRCNCTGPTSTDKDIAIKSWNNRRSNPQ